MKKIQMSQMINFVDAVIRTAKCGLGVYAYMDNCEDF